MDIALHNSGNINVEDFTLTLTSSSPYLTFSGGVTSICKTYDGLKVGYYETKRGYSSLNTDNLQYYTDSYSVPYTFTIADNCPTNTTITFNLYKIA